MTHPDTPGAAVELDLLREAIVQLGIEIDADPDGEQEIAEFCEASELPPATLRRAVPLVAETWPSDPDGWPIKDAMLDPVEHLAVIVAAIENELIRGEKGDGHKLWKRYAGGPYADENKAAYGALEACGGMEYMEGLDRFAVQRQHIPGDRLDDVYTITENTGDAPKWIEVDEVGWVLFNQAP